MPDDAGRRNVRRVLMTADGVGGVWSYTLDLSRALAARGVTVHVAIMGPSLTSDQRAEAAAAGVDTIEGPFKLEWMDAAWADVDGAAGWLLDLERTLDPDVVHLNGYCHGALSWRAPLVVVGHSCMRSWWSAVHDEDAPEPWDEYRRRVHAGLLAASLVVAPTQAMLDELGHHYGPLRASCVIASGRAFTPALHVARQPIVFAAGRLRDEARNIEALCAAARDITWPVYIAGDDRHQAGHFTVPGYVHDLGRLSPDEIRDWYARASIYALPARYEPFGLSVLEAALSGCALVLGDIRSLRENWGGAALFVPPDNRRALAFAVQSLIDNPDLRDVLATAAQMRAQRFSVDRMADAYLAAYERVAQRDAQESFAVEPIVRPSERDLRHRIGLHGGDVLEAVY